MKKISLVRGTAIAAALAAITVVCTASADEKKQEQKFCTALASLDANVSQLKGLTPQSSVGEDRTVHDRINADANEVRKSASKMKSPTAKDFDGAVDKLSADVKKIPDDASLEKVRDQIKADAQAVDAAGRQLAAESQCPTASR